MAEKKDPYAHRKHRVKYQQGYGAEGAARGINHVGGDSKGTDPRLETEKRDDARESEDKDE